LGTRSAEKAHRQSLRRHLRNRAVKSATKTAVKKANAAILSHDINAARDAVRAAIVALDKAAQKGVLHANNSARHKSRLLIKYNAAVAVLQSPGAEAEAPKKARARKAAAEATAKAPKRAAAKKPAAKKTTKK
jgi:small subunit ribosomal protein S20